MALNHLKGELIPFPPFQLQQEKVPSGPCCCCCCCVALVVSDSVRPHRRQPTRLPHPWDSPGNTGVGCHFLLQCMKVKSESEVAQSCPTLVTPWSAAFQAPLSMGFSRQEYWSGVPLPSPKAAVPEIKLPTSTASWKKQESSRKTSISALLTMPKLLTLLTTIYCGKF